MIPRRDPATDPRPGDVWHEPRPGGASRVWRVDSIGEGGLPLLSSECGQQVRWGCGGLVDAQADMGWQPARVLDRVDPPWPVDPPEPEQAAAKPPPVCTEPGCAGVCAGALAGLWCLACGARAYA